MIDTVVSVLKLTTDISTVVYCASVSIFIWRMRKSERQLASSFFCLYILVNINLGLLSVQVRHLQCERSVDLQNPFLEARAAACSQSTVSCELHDEIRTVSNPHRPRLFAAGSRLRTGCNRSQPLQLFQRQRCMAPATVEWRRLQGRCCRGVGDTCDFIGLCVACAVSVLAFQHERCFRSRGQESRSGTMNTPREQCFDRSFVDCYDYNSGAMFPLLRRGLHNELCHRPSTLRFKAEFGDTLLATEFGLSSVW